RRAGRRAGHSLRGGAGGQPGRPGRRDQAPPPRRRVAPLSLRRLDEVRTPFLTAANWGGQGLHPRGNLEGFTRAASTEKWLEVHGLEHWTHFYTAYGVGLQKRFFGHFLKGEDTGWDRQPPVQLQVRHPDRFVERHENEWPLARTRWTRYFLHPADRGLRPTAPAGDGRVEYEALGDGLTFRT